ncbi:MAG: MmgE/PrpD family protein, partial [Desulfosudaceae bacterium]
MTDTASLPVTEKIAAFIADTGPADIPEEMYQHAQVAFMDWVAVTLGGRADPLVDKLIGYTDRLGGSPQATIFGRGGLKKSLADAALINGAASHALDYDDTLVSFLGHPSVTLFPALVALSEWREASGRDLLDAYLIGLQAGSVVGACASLDHYMAGWHATATLGHIAAAAGCARLLGLSKKQAQYALGIGAT